MDMLSLSCSISHFLNCLLSSCPTPSCTVPDQIHKKRSRNKSKKTNSKQSPLAPTDSVEWANLTPKTLWLQIKNEAKSYFDWNLPVDNIDAFVEMIKLTKLNLLRSFCQKTGVQIMLREYQFENKTVQTFSEDDIVNMYPIVKHINPRATDAYNFYTTGQSKIQQGYLKDGYELISEALNLLNNVYGAMHPEIAQCLRMLARLNYIMGDHMEAMSCQQKAVLMSERVNGIDHPYTITEYTHLALYCFANTQVGNFSPESIFALCLRNNFFLDEILKYLYDSLQVSTALKLLYRARYLALMVTGENHPELALIDSNIGLILHAVGEYDISLRFLEKALALNLKYHGVKSLKVAVSYHLVARTQSCMGDFRSALTNEKETFTIYKTQLGDEHEKTKESGECLKHLTQQAVVLQKKMNDLYQGKTKAGLPPIQIQPPSMSSVLDMLNIINGNIISDISIITLISPPSGILFVQISQQDIENFKKEYEMRQKDGGLVKKPELEE